MRRISSSVIICLIIMLCFGSLINAQDEIEVDFGVKSVIFFWNDTENFRFSLDAGWTLGGELILWFPGGFGVGGEVEFYTTTEELSPFPGVDVEVSFDQMPITVNGYYRLSSEGLKPYVGGGIAFVRNSADISTSFLGTTVEESISDTFTGFTAFTGIEFGTFYFEAQWLQVDVDLGLDASMIGDNANREASGLSIWVGLRF